MPIVGGVVIASITEATFNWGGFLSAMFSNITFQSRNVLSKKLMISKGSLDNMNLFQIITIMAFFMLLPVQFLFEGGPFLPHKIAAMVRASPPSSWGAFRAECFSCPCVRLSMCVVARCFVAPRGTFVGARVAFGHRVCLPTGAMQRPTDHNLPCLSATHQRQQHSNPKQGLSQDTQLMLAQRLLGAGLCFHAYQQLSYMILSQVTPVTHSIGNCIKRVVVIVASVIILQNPVSTQNAIGTGLALFGVFLYSQAKRRYKSAPKAA